MRGENMAIIPVEWTTGVTLGRCFWIDNEVYGVEEETTTGCECVGMGIDSC